MVRTFESAKNRDVRRFSCLSRNIFTVSCWPRMPIPFNCVFAEVPAPWPTRCSHLMRFVRIGIREMIVASDRAMCRCSTKTIPWNEGVCRWKRVSTSNLTFGVHQENGTVTGGSPSSGSKNGRNSLSVASTCRNLGCTGSKKSAIVPPAASRAY